jgi:hypothetical protein
LKKISSHFNTINTTDLAQNYILLGNDIHILFQLKISCFLSKNNLSKSINFSIMIDNSNLLSSIDDRKRIEILRKNWMSQDAKSQMAIVQEFGWDKGNKLNKAIIEEMGKVMMYRLINALGIKHVKNINEFVNICFAALNFYYPPPAMSYKFQRVSDTEINGIIEKCSAIENVKSIGVQKFYECGCFAMRSGWYRALGVKVQETCLSCMKDGADNCKINLKIKKWS